jgi:hypothetical protein
MMKSCHNVKKIIEQRFKLSNLLAERLRKELGIEMYPRIPPNLKWSEMFEEGSKIYNELKEEEALKIERHIDEDYIQN